MAQERVHALDDAARELFARKGEEGGPDVPQKGEANGVKVRRVMQIVRDLAPAPFERLRILDLGCGEGVYALEAALRGATVVAVDGRTERMRHGAACAARHGLGNVAFREDDVRRATRETYGAFDVVLLLGILYHLDAPDLFDLLASVRAMAGLTVIDTLVASDAPAGTGAPDRATHGGATYEGRRVREHGDDDPPELRRSRVLKSLDNTHSFRPTRGALLRALHDAGFTSAYECFVPAEPGKAADRATFVARSGEPVVLSTYPWVNGRSDEDIARTLGG
jgi:SAM-dependent methyltransferase